jgi:hypothetical protein
LQESGLDVFFCEPNVNKVIIEGVVNYTFEAALRLDCLFVIAQKHDIFMENQILFKNKSIIDFVGLLK